MTRIVRKFIWIRDKRWFCYWNGRYLVVIPEFEHAAEVV